MANGLSLQDVLHYIQREWSFMTEDNCVPVQVALQLMDSSSLGRAHQSDQFQETHKQLQKALRGIVNEYHQGFNSSMATFHNIQSGIHNSQNRVRSLRDGLALAQSSLSSPQPELKGLAASSQEYEDMLKILNQIEQLQLIPEKLEARISEKKFLTAVDVLQEGLRIVRTSDTGAIGALTDVTAYVTNQETMVEDTTSNPEADNFQYIQLLLESLNKMGRLKMTVENIEQRMPTELFRLVERTSTDVEQRYRDVIRPRHGQNAKNELDIGDDETRQTIITDFLSTLYSKFEAIAEGHRVVHDVITGISKREHIDDTTSLAGSFGELWKLYQNEIRTILHDYLATDGHSAFRSARNQPGRGTVFGKSHRDKSKKIFKFSDIDGASSELVTAQNDLESILKLSVPGLVSESRRPVGLPGNDSNAHHDGSATGHKLLVEPSVFNMGYLLPPSLAFLQRLKDIVPDKAETDVKNLTSFLDDFLINVFHPQLDEALTELSAHIFIELDAFQQDPQSAHIAKKPIFKSTSAFVNLVMTFCRMLDTIPKDQAIIQLIITQMETYYDKCRGHYKSLVTRAQSQTEGGIGLKAASSLSEAEDLREVSTKLWQGDGEKQQQLIEKETTLLIAHTHETPLEPSSLISDQKAITSLCLLYTSMRWLVSKISRFRRVSDNPVNTSHRDEKERRNIQWILQGSTQTRMDASSVYLPLAQENITAFDTIMSSYEDLATSVLLTIHMEIRANIILNVTKSLRNNYLLEQQINEPDPDLLTLNADLVTFDEVVSTYLRPQEHKFIITGLGHLIDTLLVTQAGSIGAMNLHGCERLQLNMLVLQQNLKNIEHDVTLTRSARYFDLFNAGPDAIIAKVKEAAAGGEGRAADGGGGGGGEDEGQADLGFGYEQLKVLVELSYSANLASAKREVAVLAKRQLVDQLLALSEHTWRPDVSAE
ncbi:MAG: hypothetical protein M1816_003236 [Peltula sp. TS41687]|nr:MAG: hypothetical protein M1816_003236 [Peltula sp. TS41687]